MKVSKLVCTKGEVHGFAVEDRGAYLGHQFEEGEGKTDADILTLAAANEPPPIIFAMAGMAKSELLEQASAVVGEELHLEYLADI